jgi:hypothetical protein
MVGQRYSSAIFPISVPDEQGECSISRPGSFTLGEKDLASPLWASETVYTFQKKKTHAPLWQQNHIFTAIQLLDKVTTLTELHQLLTFTYSLYKRFCQSVFTNTNQYTLAQIRGNTTGEVPQWKWLMVLAKRWIKFGRTGTNRYDAPVTNCLHRSYYFPYQQNLA